MASFNVLFILLTLTGIRPEKPLPNVEHQLGCEGDLMPNDRVFAMSFVGGGDPNYVTKAEIQRRRGAEVDEVIRWPSERHRTFRIRGHA